MDEWLTLTQAAKLVGCSRKTLYRYMARRLLAYRREADNRRYVKRADVLSLFETRRDKMSQWGNADCCTGIAQVLEGMTRVLEAHNDLIMRMIQLYQPRTLSDLAKKHV